MQQETLKQTADREAREAEAEHAPRPLKRKVKAKKNGKAKANGEAEAAVSSKPGEQGTATQERETKSEAPSIWKRPDVSTEDRKNADEVFHKLRSDAVNRDADALRSVGMDR